MSVFFLSELVKVTEQISSFSPLGNLIRMGMSVTAVYYFYSDSTDFTQIYITDFGNTLE